jgi:hypothetical protein
MPRHLWEIDHPYYCNEGNYFSRACGSYFKSWADFLTEWGDADIDYNLLFRFDWVEGEDHELPVFNGDEHYRNGRLKIFWMGQRKGIYQFSIVDVCRADEPDVIAFLRPRWEHLKGALGATLRLRLSTPGGLSGPLWRTTAPHH